MCSSIPVDKRLVYFPFSLLEKQKDASWILNSKAVSEFLQQYKHSPVLFRNCFPDLFFAITPEELAGLACEDGFVSRIVQLCHPSSKEDKVWKVSWGPFSEESFENFPERNATLLVNDVERAFPQVEELLGYFRFISNYRLDDVMLSYATCGGGVGPHIDNYDVFLIQTRGKRKWRLQLSPLKKDEEDWLPGQDLRVLRSIPSMDVECILEPGDMLYLPARYPHW